MEQAIKNLIKNIAQKMGKKWDISAQSISSEIYGPTVRKAMEVADSKNGAFFIKEGLMHNAEVGHKAIFSISAPKADPEDYIRDWVNIEIGGLRWDPDGFRHYDSMYSFPEANSLSGSEYFEETVKVAALAPKIIKDFERILTEVKASEHAKNIKKLGL